METISVVILNNNKAKEMNPLGRFMPVPNAGNSKNGLGDNSYPEEVKEYIEAENKLRIFDIQLPEHPNMVQLGMDCKIGFKVGSTYKAIIINKTTVKIL